MYLLALPALLLYLASYYFVWQQRDKQPNGGLALWLLLGAIACHAGFSHTLLYQGAHAQLSLVYVINIIGLVMVSVVCLISLKLPTDKLLLLITPISLLALVVGLVAPIGSNAASHLTQPLLFHIVISLAAYTALMLAACQSILLGMLERQLKSPDRRAIGWLPPLETMEQLLVAMLWIGLALLSGAILTGFIFLEDMFAQHVSHHIVITSLSWLVYAFFLAGRYLFGWRGLTAVRWTLVAFALLVIGYLGSKFVLEYLLAPTP